MKSRSEAIELTIAIATGAEIIGSGNIGCLTQLRLHLAKLGSPIQVRHTMQVLRDASRAPSK